MGKIRNQVTDLRLIITITLIYIIKKIIIHWCLRTLVIFIYWSNERTISPVGHNICDQHGLVLMAECVKQARRSIKFLYNIVSFTVGRLLQYYVIYTKFTFLTFVFTRKWPFDLYFPSPPSILHQFQLHATSIREKELF